MKIKVSFIVGLIVCLTNSCFSIEIDELRQIIEAMESAYIDISVDYTWNQDPPMTEEDITGTSNLIPVGKVQKTFMTARPFSNRSLSSEKLKLMDEHGTSFDSESKESYNGSIAKHLTIGGWPKSVMDGTITKRKDFMATASLNPLKFSVFYNYPLLLSDSISNEQLCKINSEAVLINGFNAISLDIKTETGYKYRRVYFSVDHGYTPVRFEFLSNNKAVVSIDVLELKNISEGLWFPVKGHIKSADDERVEIYEANAITVNQGLTKSDFDFEFPPGTRIVDEIADLQYVIRPTEEQFNKWLKDEEIISRYSNSNNTPTDVLVTTTTDVLVTTTLDTTKKQPEKIEGSQNKARSKLLWTLIILPVIVVLVVFGIIKYIRIKK